jgi:hypothetical protein
MLTSPNMQLPSGWFPDELITQLPVWHPPSALVNVLGLFGTVVLMYYVAYLMLRPRRQVPDNEGDMVKHFRNARVRFIVGEGITEFIEEAVFRDKITRAESIDVYNKIGREFGLTDLLPKKKVKQKLSRGETEHLKEQIKERIAKQTTGNVVTMERKLGSMLKKGA